MTNWRERCAELLQALETEGYAHWTVTPDKDELCLRTRAELAQPEPEGVSLAHEACVAFVQICKGNSDDAGTYEADEELVRCALKRLSDLEKGRPAIEPVPPEPGVADHVTDDEGTRWDRTTDAALWAKAFCLICPEMASREDVMIGWFANAIMAGWDHHGWKTDAERKPIPVSERLPGAEDCDLEGRCWLYGPHLLGGEIAAWVYGCPAWAQRFTAVYSHWLPHYALPVPITEEAP